MSNQRAYDRHWDRFVRLSNQPISDEEWERLREPIITKLVETCPGPRSESIDRMTAEMLRDYPRVRPVGAEA